MFTKAQSVNETVKFISYKSVVLTYYFMKILKITILDGSTRLF